MQATTQEHLSSFSPLAQGELGPEHQTNNRQQPPHQHTKRQMNSCHSCQCGSASPKTSRRNSDQKYQQHQNHQALQHLAARVASDTSLPHISSYLNAWLHSSLNSSTQSTDQVQHPGTRRSRPLSDPSTHYLFRSVYIACFSHYNSIYTRYQYQYTSHTKAYALDSRAHMISEAIDFFHPAKPRYGTSAVKIPVVCTICDRGSEYSDHPITADITILRVQLSLTASHSIAFLEILRHVQTSAAAASCMEYSARYGNCICHRLYDEYAP
jgi:hypothetical protein